MFRELVRKKQALTPEECVEVLKKEKRGVLSVCGDDGYPYGVPLNHWYCEENGHIYFHGCMTGHRVDAIDRCDKVSFCVYDEGYREEGDWALNFKSVIVFGRMKRVEDPKEALEKIVALSYHFINDAEYIQKEVDSAAGHTLCLELIPEFITGKRVNES